METAWRTSFRPTTHYDLIQEYYLGKIAIIPYLYDGEHTDMPQVYNAIKGKTETHDQEGRILDKCAVLATD